jgi:hypothetical protein
LNIVLVEASVEYEIFYDLLLSERRKDLPDEFPHTRVDSEMGVLDNDPFEVRIIIDAEPIDKDVFGFLIDSDFDGVVCNYLSAAQALITRP